MNELNQLTGLLDGKWAHIATITFVAAGIIGRIYKAIINGGGLVSICHALFYGTNTPKPLDKPESKGQVIDTTKTP